MAATMKNLLSLLESGHVQLTVPKVWGYENWHHNGEVCFKSLVVYPGFRCSAHYHRTKYEIFLCVEGVLLVHIYGRTEKLLPGEFVVVRPFMVHSFESATEDKAVFVEMSTHHREDDSYRVTTSHRFDMGGTKMEEKLGVIGRFMEAKVAVLGDIMLDGYWDGSVERMSPEAPVPVVHNPDRSWRLGGMANTAANIRALGAGCQVFAVVGPDPNAATIKALLRVSGIESFLAADESRPTTTKIRIVSETHHITRIDDELIHHISDDIEYGLLERLDQALAPAEPQGEAAASRKVSAVAFSDYDKGTLTEDLIANVVARANERQIPIVADAKHRHFWHYKNVTLFKCNARRAGEELDTRLVTASDFAKAMGTIGGELDPEWIMITRGKDGMSLRCRDGRCGHVAARYVEVSELSGAGDTVTAVMAICLGIGMEVMEAAQIANVAASIVVSKSGTATLTPLELSAALQ